ncbi:hypothetical protein BU26DRAFT_329887 [Trematosphaeria pertusa]|uniref:Uncharacterized protein n=1 Tax=Trematosphaeria pertusa TaxID=390896 RepID=A0A6A6IDV3_9PLEO|nr:uncharacterized protein BU26DRAFT_329887 [Trematosphaeria pertusa]KAF2248238.1 hypothetical protein BU26DRAFT_329887 [Trematosphaeria pertusa]
MSLLLVFREAQPGSFHFLTSGPLEVILVAFGGLHLHSHVGVFGSVYLHLLHSSLFLWHFQSQYGMSRVGRHTSFALYTYNAFSMLFMYNYLNVKDPRQSLPPFSFPCCTYFLVVLACLYVGSTPYQLLVASLYGIGHRMPDASVTSLREAMVWPSQAKIVWDLALRFASSDLLHALYH